MAQQIKFYLKNIIDIQNEAAGITVTDLVADSSGQDIVDFVRNRNNVSAWLTTGSTDAANTQLDVEFGVGRDLNRIILVKHNWKAFTIQYWDGATYQNFSTPINESANDDEVTEFAFNTVETDRIRIIITGAQVVDADKELYQLICTESMGQLQGWPVIKAPTHDTNKKTTKMLSGKVHVIESVGGFSLSLTVTQWRSIADLTLVEDLYFSEEAFIMWPCGGDEDQFFFAARGYRLEDFFVCRCTDNYVPELVKGIYQNGQKMDIQLAEAIV